MTRHNDEGLMAGLTCGCGLFVMLANLALLGLSVWVIVLVLQWTNVL